MAFCAFAARMKHWPGMAAEVRVFDCPECHAPLPPAADGAHVTCTFCGQATTIDYSGAAMVREQASREAAEKLYATLGHPPTWSQKVALVLTNKWLWILGLPFMLALFARLGSLPEHATQHAYEALTHARMMHVISPIAAWVLGIVWQAGLLGGVMVWSLFGARVDARRDLQVALASKPPKTEGGPARCRHCDAALVFAAGALGTRCEHCGADNLVQVPAAWASRATKIDAALRLTADVARTRALEGRRRVRRAASWRVPVVLALLAIVGWPAFQARNDAAWTDYRQPTSPSRIDVFRRVIWQAGQGPTHALASVATCDDPHVRHAVATDSRLATGDSKWCERGACEVVAMFALARGEKLRLVWTAPGAAALRVSLGDVDYPGDDGVLADGFGDTLASTTLEPGAAGATASEVPIETSGWYKVDLRGAPGIVVEPCLVPAR